MNRQLNYVIIQIIIISLFSLSSIYAQDSVKTKNEGNEKEVQIKHGPKFVDEDGDGFNDNAPDHDGDGIPNGLDPDYKRPGKEKKKKFVDLDGDGIDDNIYNEGVNERSGGMGPNNNAASTQSGKTQKKMKRKKSGNK